MATMTLNRIIEILEDVTMVDHRGAINAADEIMEQIQAERNAARVEAQELRNTLAQLREQMELIAEQRDALRDALVSLVDGKSEFDIEYDTGMPADEARKIMDLAYNRA